MSGSVGQCLIKIKVKKNTLLLFLQDMADAWHDQWVPVYSQSSNGIHEGRLHPIPSTPHTPHIQHSSSTGNLHAQAAREGLKSLST